MKKSLITFALGVMLIAQPVSAASMADLQAQINSLMQILQTLIAQVQALPQAPSPIAPPVPDPFPLPHLEPPVQLGDATLKAEPSDSPDGKVIIFTASHGDGNSYPPSHSDGQDTRIDFGDGSEHQWVHCFTGNKNIFSTGKCQTPAQYKHMYKKPGTYTASLIKEGGYCRAPGCPTTILAEVRVTILGRVTPQEPTYCTMEYAPVCGQPQGCSACPEGAYCTMLCAMPEPKTYGNKCQLKSAHATYLYKGACKPAPTPTNTPPTIEAFGGPTVLKVNKTGKWKIEANDNENDNLTYRVDWGDQPQIMYAQAAPARIMQDKYYNQSTTFEHAYTRAGKYTVRITVQDEHGLQTNTSTTVIVEEVGNNTISNSCKSWYDGCNTCSRSYPGGPALCTLRACYRQQPAYCKATFDTPQIQLPQVLLPESFPIDRGDIDVQEVQSVVGTLRQALPSLSIFNRLF